MHPSGGKQNCQKYFVLEWMHVSLLDDVFARSVVIFYFVFSLHTVLLPLWVSKSDDLDVGRKILWEEQCLRGNEDVLITK